MLYYLLNTLQIQPDTGSSDIYKLRGQQRLTSYVSYVPDEKKGFSILLIRKTTHQGSTPCLLFNEIYKQIIRHI